MIDAHRCSVNSLHELHGERATWTTCRPCEDWIRDRLDDVERRWPELPDYLERGRGHSGVRGSRAVVAPLPLAERVLDLIGPGGVHDRLGRHDAAIRTARGLHGEPVTGSVDYRMRIVLRNLRRHLAWAAANHDLGPLALEARTLVAQMTGVAGEPPATVQLATLCAAEYDNGPCGGTLLYNRTTHVVACADCGQAVPDEQLLPATR